MPYIYTLAIVYAITYTSYSVYAIHWVQMFLGFAYPVAIARICTAAYICTEATLGVPCGVLCGVCLVICALWCVPCGMCLVVCALVCALWCVPCGVCLVGCASSPDPTGGLTLIIITHSRHPPPPLTLTLNCNHKSPLTPLS